MIRKIKDYIVQTHGFQMTTVRLHQRNRRKELMQLCGDVIQKYKNEPQEQLSEQNSKYIWVCWWQGEQEMSPIVKECYRRICNYNKNKNVILITEKNLKDWVSFPDYILKKYQQGIITKTHFSDLLRMELLKEYGGVWMDITLLTFGAVPEEFYRFPVYTGRFPYNKMDYNVSKNRWTSYFWVSRYSNNILFRYMSDFWRTYWKQKDELIEYFLVDYALDFGYCNIPAMKQELDAVPLNGCGKDIWKLLHILPQSYDKTVIESIIRENWMQKLSYKGEAYIQDKATDPPNSFYQKLFLDGTNEE